MSAAKGNEYPETRRAPSIPGAASSAVIAQELLKPPRHLSAPAKKLFRQYALELQTNGTLRRVDVGSLSIYCQALADIERLTLEIRREDEGEIKTGPNGGAVWNPKIGLINRAQGLVEKFGDRLGLNARARSSIKFPAGQTPAPTGEPDPSQLEFSQFLAEQKLVAGQSWNSPDAPPPASASPSSA